MNWQQAFLKEVVTGWIKGSTPSRAHKGYYTKKPGVPWVKVSDLKDRDLQETESYLTSEGAQQVGRWVPKGAVLLSVSGTIGKTALAKAPLMVNQAVQAMVFDETIILAEYAYYYFQFFKPWLETLANTVTIPNLTKKKLENTCILFPSIEEQRYIVHMLEKAENIVREQRRTYQEAENILSSIRERQREDSLEAGQFFFQSVESRIRQIQEKAKKIEEKTERFYQSMLTLAFTARLTRNFRAFNRLEEPDEEVILRFYHAKFVENEYDAAYRKYIDLNSHFRGGQRRLIEFLSDFQKEMLRKYLEAEIPMPIHAVLKELKTENSGICKGYSIQDAISTVKILEKLGFLEKTTPEKIYLGENEITDLRGKPVTIQKYQAALAGMED